MDDEQAVIYEAANSFEAHELRILLEGVGIPAWVVNDALQGAAGALPLGSPSAPRVVVARQDMEQARRMATAFDGSMRRSEETDEDAPDGERPFAGEEAWDAAEFSWPVCPECERRRLTVCPVCQAADTDLPLADRPDMVEEEGEQVEQTLLLCLTCDEPFAPRFPRRCEWCGHDFGEGVEPPPRAERESISGRMLLTMLGVVGVMAALAAYFALLTAR